MKKGILKYIVTGFAVFTIFTSNLWAADQNKGLVKENVLAYRDISLNPEVTCYLNAGEELVIVEEKDNYYGVLIEKDEVVYIEKKYLQVQNEILVDEPVNKVVVEESQVTHKGQEVVNYAKQFIGLNYRSGGTSLTTGVDCSGFTQQIYANFDVSLKRSSREQYASNGKAVNKEELLPGDLVFYGVGGNVRHVAIYVGSDQIIHAPVPGKSVCIVPLRQRGDDPIIGYKRIF